MKALLSVVLAVALSLSMDCFAESSGRPEVFLQLGHSGLVHAVAVSPDGSLVASADFGGVTRLWKTSGNKEIGSFPKERMPILKLVWSPDGRLVFAGTADGRLLWLDAQRLEKSREQSCASSGSLFELRAVAVSRDGREVACGNLDGNISVFSVADGKLLRVIDTGGDGVRAMAVTPDGGAIIAGGLAKIQRFRWRDGRLIGAFPVPDLVANIAVFKRTPRIAVSFGFLFYGKETAIRGYDLDTGNETFVLTGSRGGSQALAISPDERTLYTGMFTRANAAAKNFIDLFSTDFRIHEWSLEKKAIVRSFEGHSANVAGIALAPSGERLYSASWDETLRAWNLRTGSGERLAGRGIVPAAVFLTDDRIGAADPEGGAIFWDRKTGEMVRRVRATIPEGLRGRPFQLRGVGVGKGGVVTVVQDNVDSVLIQRAGTGNEMSVTEVRPDFESWRSIEAEKWLGFDSQGAQRKVFPILAHATVSGDGRWAYLAVKYMAVGNLFTFASRIAVWDVDGARLSGFMPGILDGEVSAMGLAPDGKTLLLGLGQSIRQEVESPRRTTLAAYRVADGKRLWSRDYSAQGSLVNIAVAPDGNQLAAIAGGLLATVEMASGAERQRFAGAEKQLKAVAFSDDGKVLAAGGHDSRFLAWDAGTGQSIARLAGHTGEIQSIKFIPGGDWALSAGSDHQVKLWDLKKNDELLTFASFAGGEVDWVTLTPEGYFAASSGGTDLVGFHIGNRLYQLNQFYDLFYRPDLVRRRLAGEAIDGLGPERILQAIGFPPPDVWVKMESAPAAADSVTMRLSVRSAGGGIGEVRVFHNGKLVRSDGFIRPVEQQTLNLTEQTPALVTRGLAATSRHSRLSGETGQQGDVFEEVIRLVPVTGDNEIAVTAFNRDNTVQSRFVTTSFVSGRRMAAPRVFLVAIGVNEFKAGGKIALEYAAKDASDIAAFLKSHAGQVNLGALADSVVLLDRQATKAAIAAAFDTLARKIGPQDALVLFVATHGLFDADGYVFLTHDFDGTVRQENSIGAAEVIEYLKRIPAQRQLVILDTCHAGGMNHALDGLYDARMTILARNAGLHVMASAGSLEEAIDGFEHNGLFTHVLLQGLQSSVADLNVDGRISVFELGDYGRQAADRLARSVGHSQTPVILRYGRDYPVYQLKP